MAGLVDIAKRAAMGFLKKDPITSAVLGLDKKKGIKELDKGPVELLSGDEEKLRKARKKSIQAQLAGSGRSSTILSQGGTGFGG